MKQRKLLLILVLLCAVVQGAWAQSSWDEVYAITQTNSANWTQLTEGSTTGKTLGTAGSTTYYYADANLTFSNSTVSGSGLTILGTVYFYVPDGVTVTCTGAHANGQMGGGAGIELTEGNTLYLLGSGTLNATGGNAADGGNGGNGTDASCDFNSMEWAWVGGNGHGGNGGGGAGAGIGTRGGTGGAGGNAPEPEIYYTTWTENGVAGSAGSAGQTAGAKGELHVSKDITINATGGSQGSAGTAGTAGKSCMRYGSREYSIPGGGGGGAGGFGGAANNIGPGGPGGGGGGGGAKGSHDRTSTGFYIIYANGGGGGQNGDGSYAASGGTAGVSTANINNGTCDTNDLSWVQAEERGKESSDVNTTTNGGAGGACGTSIINDVVSSETTTMTSGSYTVLFDVTVQSRIQISGNVTLNLGEGATLMAKKGIEVSKGNSLTINGPGALTIDGCDKNKSGIGAFEVGIITINGGTINVRGGAHGAGIGGDEHNEDGGTIIINGGVVTAQGAGSAAGIGGGCGDYTTDGHSSWGRCGNIIINGGQVTARGGDETAGIGPGFSLMGSNSGTLTLGWTNAQEDFIYCSGFKSGSSSYGKITLNSITFAEGKQFVIDGTATIATSSNIGGQKIVPYTTEQLPLSGAGTLENPWRISSVADWNVLAQNIIAGNSYSGEYVQLDADIEIAGGVGGHDEKAENDRPFSGTFLGNNKTITAAFSSITWGAAPFRYISGATIKNLTVAGTITSNQYYTSGLVGFADGENLIEGCIVSATINQNSDYAGGFVGNGKTSTTTIRDCIFQGTVNGTNYVDHVNQGWHHYETTHNVCGFWGYGDEGSTLIMQNCLEKGTYNTIDGMHPIGLQNGTSNVTNTHYLTPQSGPLSHTVVGGAYRAYSVNTAEGEMLRPVQLLDGNTYYTPCIITLDDSYRLEDNSVSVTPVVKASDETTLLTLGTDYTATVDGTEVTSYPMSFTSLGFKTFTITGLGNCNGSTSARFIVIGQKGEGTPENPYTISNTGEWDAFAYQVNHGNSYSGKYVQLDADIDIDLPVGVRTSDTDTKPFSGTFLGNNKTIQVSLVSDGNSGLAPFRQISGATIKDLKVAGTIASDHRHTSGLVGFADGTNLIENCVVTATINQHSDYAGGIVGHGLTSNTTLRGCVFAGIINGIDMSEIIYSHDGYQIKSWSPAFIGGIWGWSDSGTPTLENCLEAGTYTNIWSMHPIGLQGGSGSITNCYYVKPQIGSPTNACTVSGAKQAYTITSGTGVTMANSGEVRITYDVSRLTFYNGGLKYGEMLYAACDDVVSLTLSHDTNGDCNFIQYVASGGGTLSTQDATSATLTMPASNVTIRSSWAIPTDGSGNHLISAENEWDVFCTNVESGMAYSGQTVKLMADISVSTMAGASETNSFQGTFLGGGHTITAAITDNINGGAAPFRYIKNATIKNLTVAGTITSNQRHMSGLVGFADSEGEGKNLIEGCTVTATLNINTDYAGGIIGHGKSSATTIRGCVFAGTMNSNSNPNVGVIWGWSDSATPTLENSLEAGTYTGISKLHPMGLQKAAGTITNCYYTTPQIGSPENACTVSGARHAYAVATAPAKLGNLVQDYGKVKVYDNGILYDGTYYVIPTPLAGSGTEDEPYIINNDYDWNSFAYHVNNGTNYSDQFVKLYSDISVSEMVGSSETNSFQGTFLGDGVHTLTFTAGSSSAAFGEENCAPFRYTKDATIRDLKVTGTIYTSRKFAAGLVARNSGTTTITNCQIGTVIHSSFRGDGTHGGIVAMPAGSTTTNITGCIYNGRLLTTKSTTYCGGFVGWSGDNTVTVVHSLYAPDANIVVAAGETAIDNGATFVRGNKPTVEANCYYTETMGSAQGTHAYALATAPANFGNLVQDYGMLQVYGNGILYDGTYYVAPATVSLADNADNSTTISGANGYMANVTLQSRTLYRDGDWNTLCLPFSLDNIYGTCLQGATVKTLESTGFSDGTLTMNFTENVNGIEAGKPYIVKWEPVDLSTLTTHYTAQDGETLTGTLGANVKISIAAGATVKLQDVTINGTNDQRYSWAGISCLGNATIILKGTNNVSGFSENYSGIYVPSGSTLTIKGSGSLTARGSDIGAGIGAEYYIPCGNIVIEGGTINAYGGWLAAGIGGSWRALCGDITITDGVTKVYAESGSSEVGAIGAGYYSSCGTVTIGGTVGAITASSHTYTGTRSGSVDVAMPNLVNPEFKSVINSDAPANVETDYVDFVGTYSPVSLPAGDRSNLYLGAGNTLYWPASSGRTINAFRAYFQLKQGLTAGESTNSQQSSVRAFVLNFGDDEGTTGIVEMRNEGNEGNKGNERNAFWYTLDGRRLSGKPTKSGVYINGGRKVVVK